MRANGPSRLLLTVILLTCHLLLPAVVWATPPDPLGSSQGIFDAADADDIVLHVIAMTGVVSEPPPDGGPIHLVMSLPMSSPAVHSLVVVLGARLIRAPPAS
jgi:hypothetical protein